jgi:hypothetical protein
VRRRQRRCREVERVRCSADDGLGRWFVVTDLPSLGKGVQAMKPTSAGRGFRKPIIFHSGMGEWRGYSARLTMARTDRNASI